MRIAKGVKVVAMNDQMKSASGLDGATYLGLRTVQPGDTGIIADVQGDMVTINFDCADGRHVFHCSREVAEMCCAERTVANYRFDVLVDGELPHGAIATLEHAERVAAEYARNLNRGGVITDSGKIVKRFDAPRAPFASVAFTSVEG